MITHAAGLPTFANRGVVECVCIEHYRYHHVRWLVFREGMWFNGSDFICRLDPWDSTDTGEGEVREWR